MKVSRFKYLLDSYGTVLERWPESEREVAKEVLDVSVDARDLYTAALSLDAALAAQEITIDATTVTRMRRVVRDRVAKAPLAEPRISALHVFSNLLMTKPYARLASLALAVGVSMWIGWSSAYAAPPDLLSALETNPIVGAGQ